MVTKFVVVRSAFWLAQAMDERAVEGALMAEPWICMVLALVAVVATFGLRARAALGADEGYLWFGVQQLLKGRLPHRDFKSL
ncbi:MAG: hypothetical protein H7A20_04025 [Rhodanobacteraceae bacterium]|nr:hypothetical protein [Rhodanobacteraceae bacterium]